MLGDKSHASPVDFKNPSPEMCTMMMEANPRTPESEKRWTDMIKKSTALSL